MRWKLIGIEFHRWRTGTTWLDRFRGNSVVEHHGFYSLEWARGENVEFCRALRQSFWRR